MIRRDVVGKEKTGFVTVAKSCTEQSHGKDQEYWDGILVDCGAVNDCQKMSVWEWHFERWQKDFYQLVDELLILGLTTKQKQQLSKE